MYETQKDLSPSIRERMIALLNARLADAIGLRTQLKVAHWNVKGAHYIALHKLFDQPGFWKTHGDHARGVRRKDERSAGD